VRSQAVFPQTLKAANGTHQQRPTMSALQLRAVPRPLALLMAAVLAIFYLDAFVVGAPGAELVAQTQNQVKIGRN